MLKELEKPYTGQRIARPEPGPNWPFPKRTRLDPAWFSCVHLYFQGLLGLNSLSVPLAEERVAMEMLDDRLAARFFVT